MPDPDGRIPPVRVPEIPWKQSFRPGDPVRVIGGVEGFGGSAGSVVNHDMAGLAERSVMVELDGDWGPGSDSVFMFAPGELRRLP